MGRRGFKSHPLRQKKSGGIMELEEAKNYIRMIIRQREVPDSAKALGYAYASEAIETVLQALDNSIPKERVEKKIEELSNGIKRDMENHDKVKEESWKIAIHRTMTNRIETRKILKELL